MVQIDPRRPCLVTIRTFTFAVYSPLSYRRTWPLDNSYGGVYATLEILFRWHLGIHQPSVVLTPTEDTHREETRMDRESNEHDADSARHCRGSFR